MDIKDLAALAAVPLAWIGSMEWRLRNKVDHRHCDTIQGDLKERMVRMESHLYDLLSSQKIEPSIPPPEDVMVRNHNAKNHRPVR